MHVFIYIYMHIVFSISPTKKNAFPVNGTFIGRSFGPARSGCHPFGGDIGARPTPGPVLGRLRDDLRLRLE